MSDPNALLKKKPKVPQYPQTPYPTTPEDQTTVRVAQRAPRSSRILPPSQTSTVPEDEHCSPSLVTIEEVLASRAELSSSQAPQSPKETTPQNNLSDDSSEEEFHSPTIEKSFTKQVPQQQT